MLNTRQSPKIKLIAYTLLLPLAGLFLIANNAGAMIDRVSEMNRAATRTEADVTQMTVTQTAESGQKQPKQAGLLSEITVIGYAAPNVPPQIPVSPTPPAPPAIDVDVLPEFVGGEKAMFEFIQKSLRYPLSAQQNGIQGRVVCTFVVGVDGVVKQIKIPQKGDPDLDAEVVRCVRSMPKWRPARKDGKPVAAEYTIPFSFLLQ
jgi:TonB family protein